MRFPSTFNRECQQVAAVLEQLNPGGETPKALRRERWYQEQDRAKQEQEKIARAAHWFGLRVVGKRFDDIGQLRAACVALAETLYGGQMDDETAEVVTKAITALWLGHCEWALFREPRVVAEVTEDPRSVVFTVAA